jgi:beta-N-acetylhexosaminidase
VPVADVPVAGSDRVIGDRAFGDTPAQVAALAGAQADGLMAAGVLPVVKHLPGHGRATADSHLNLPVVDTDRATLEKTDFAAFRPLSSLPLGMTAHVVFSAIDAVQPATTSAIMIRDVIRGSIGFEGLLMSDDVSMGALSGTLAERSRAALAAGCDLVLHCNGDLAEMCEVADASPVLAGEAAKRAERALALRQRRNDIDLAAARARFSCLMQQPAAGAIV